MSTSPVAHRTRLGSIPMTAALLSAAGALPFVTLALAPSIDFEPFGRPPLVVLSLYAAVILSFMGAVHWGLAMGKTAARRDSSWQFIVSVLPALLGWFSLSFFPMAVALRVMALGFAALLLYDLRAVRVGSAPRWYAHLRWPVTVVVVASLMWGSILA
jgi:hypothetical protein